MLQLHDEASAVAPAEPGSAVVVYQHRGVYVVPPPALAVGGHLVRDKGFAYRVNKRTRGAVAHGHAHALAIIFASALRGDIIVKLAVFLHHLRCPGLAYGPLEVRGFQHAAMVCPGFHVGSGIAEPLGDVEHLLVVSLVVPGIKVERAVMHQGGGVCRELVCHHGVTFRGESLHARLLGVGHAGLAQSGGYRQ